MPLVIADNLKELQTPGKRPQSTCKEALRSDSEIRAKPHSVRLTNKKKALLYGQFYSEAGSVPINPEYYSSKSEYPADIIETFR